MIIHKDSIENLQEIKSKRAKVKRPPKYTKEEVSKALKKTGWLSVQKLNQHPELPAKTTILKLFSTTKVNDVWRELDIQIPATPNKSKYTKEAISRILKKIGWMSKNEIKRRCYLPSVSIIVSLFNTTKINDVWEELGIPLPTKQNFTKEQVVKVLRKTGWIKAEEMNTHPDLPSSTTVKKLLDVKSTHDIWRILNISNPVLPTKKGVGEILKKTGWITKYKINKHPDLPSVPTVLKLFEATSIDEVWEELNLSLNKKGNINI